MSSSFKENEKVDLPNQRNVIVVIYPDRELGSKRRMVDWR
jgi:hypothetical protein